SLNWLRNSVEASITGGSTVTAHDDVQVQADNKGSMIGVAVGAAAASTGAVGAAIAYNFIGGDPGDPTRHIDENRDSSVKGQVIAKIDGAGTTATATTADVTVSANSVAKILNVTIGAAGASTVAVAGSISINFVKEDVAAMVTGGAHVTAQNDV